MDFSPSQCNSGCESGWTHYLDQSYLSQSQFYVATEAAEVEEEEESLSLSMVSDASSGPAHYKDVDEDCLYETESSLFSVSWGSSRLGKKNRDKKSKESGRREQHLNDTASSKILNYSKKKNSFSNAESSMQNVLNYSEGFSATHMKGKPVLMHHFGFLKSSLDRSPASQKPGDFQGGNWEE